MCSGLIVMGNTRNTVTVAVAAGCRRRWLQLGAAGVCSRLIAAGNTGNTATVAVAAGCRRWWQAGCYELVL